MPHTEKSNTVTLTRSFGISIMNHEGRFNHDFKRRVFQLVIIAYKNQLHQVLFKQFHYCRPFLIEVLVTLRNLKSAL